MRREIGARRRWLFTAAGLLGLALTTGALVTESVPRGIGLAGGVLLLAAVVGMNVTIEVVRRNAFGRVRTVEASHAEIRAELGLMEMVLSSLSIGVLAIKGGRVVYANREARDVIGERGTIRALSPAVLRGAIETVGERGGEQAVRFEIDFPARTKQAVARARRPGDVVVVELADISARLHADSVRRDFVAAASHELKTPVAAIQAAAETVLTALDEDPDAVRDFSRRIHENANRLAHIVADLLDLSRLESGPAELQPVELDRIAAAEVERLVHEGVAITADLEPVKILGNPSDLMLALRNLLDNAVRYTDAPGRISLRVAAEGEHALVEVVDEGVGIPQADLPRIFERFYRVDAARSRATGGTGLGLAIVKHVAEQHGGSVSAESTLGAGSTFRIRLPLGTSRS